MNPSLIILFASLILAQLCCGQEEAREQWVVISNGVVSSVHDGETAAQQAAASQKTAFPDGYVAYTQWELTETSLDEKEVGGGGGGFCFPGDATVQVEGKQGEFTPMKNLKLGDKIRAGNDKYETIYSFGHLDDSKAKHDYLELATGTGVLVLTSDHMVMLKGGRYVPAGIVQVGDELLMADGVAVSVQSIQTVRKQGSYAPFTSSGTIVVNGIQVSSFIAFQNSETLHVGGIDTGLTYQFLAHSFESPHRLWCTWASTCLEESYTADGISTWVNGPHRLARWLLPHDGGGPFSSSVASFFVATGATVMPAAYLLYTLFLVAGAANRKIT